MGIETALADRKGKDFCELPKVTNSNNKTRKSRRRQKKMSPVQKLFETCKEVFASASTGIVPPSEDIQRLRSVLDDMKPEDVGLTPELLYFNPLLRSRTPAITYLHLYECENFSMGIFCLPPSGVIPLHNHPGMTVFSKLLFGTMHIKSYDWVDDGPSNTSAVANGDSAPDTTPNAQLAKIKVDSDFTAPCNASILYPADGGNMHRFTAVTACAVLDVLGPPYSDPDGRHCTYYHDFPFSEFSVEGVKLPEGEEEQKENYAWLQERILPEGLAVRGAPYTGPKIVE
ncbi:plant cysteine oxidase 2 [Cannabis sativa]|uniref:plant cysteine oxidase 2 n=1 Tax=Cannabis sativa TaxID=3483 RepID=UPI0029CA591A|nr:plant cysteine oxidase 2 [Cannabis sativa]